MKKTNWFVIFISIILLSFFSSAFFSSNRNNKTLNNNNSIVTFQQQSNLDNVKTQDANFYYLGRALQMFLTYHSDVDEILNSDTLNKMFDYDKDKITIFKESFVGYTVIWSYKGFDSYRDFLTQAYLYWQNGSLNYHNINYAWVNIFFTHFYPLLISANDDTNIFKFDYYKIMKLFKDNDDFDMDIISYNWIVDSSKHGVNLPGTLMSSDFDYKDNQKQARNYLIDLIHSAYSVADTSEKGVLPWKNKPKSLKGNLDNYLLLFQNLYDIESELDIYNICLSWTFNTRVEKPILGQKFSSFENLDNYFYNISKTKYASFKKNNFNPGANISLLYAIKDFAYKNSKSSEYINNLKESILNNFNILFYLTKNREDSVASYLYNFCLFSYTKNSKDTDSIIESYNQWNETRTNIVYSNQYINLAIDASSFDSDKIKDYNNFKFSNFDRFNTIEVAISKVLDGFAGVDADYDSSNTQLYSNYKQTLTPNGYLLKNYDCYIYGYSSDFFLKVGNFNDNYIYIIIGTCFGLGLIGAVLVWKRHIGV